ncbi:UTP--glucose-1-phosphate uridylyltransferase [Natronococcus amylolyticus DSM 10524]|uniref:UTP--glucose-1-phosphate uridylyltransferase n=1 Tax=Natronococcus amylolyticus DSM 10524 TaxID=1227497 RepID=L9X004_9EURY|nr:UTP--glucose-1-phosphate uridylyltransferase [Natronococcus amylolyticus DSM 10524]
MRTGFDTLTPTIFHACHLVQPADRDEDERSDAVDLLLQSGPTIDAIGLEGWRIDVGDPARPKKAPEDGAGDRRLNSYRPPPRRGLESERSENPLVRDPEALSVLLCIANGTRKRSVLAEPRTNRDPPQKSREGSVRESRHRSPVVSVPRTCNGVSDRLSRIRITVEPKVDAGSPSIDTTARSVPAADAYSRTVPASSAVARGTVVS